MSTAMTRDYAGAVAIIGMSGRFPGAHNVSELWRNVTAGVSSIRRFSDPELVAAGVPPEFLDLPNYVKVGTTIDDIDKFDAEFFGYSPREAEVMDPQHRLFLECAWEALEQAAYDPETYRGPIGVFGGSGFPTYMTNQVSTHQEVIETYGDLQMAIGNERDSLASTVSYKLNLRGPSIAVQTFCSTSLVAVHMACQSLLTYECGLALAGGVALSFPQGIGYLYEEGYILSPDGYVRSFDATGNGSVMGVGLGVVALKRMEEALADGDTIHAVILGSAVNNDGIRKVGYTAPGLQGQSSVIATALSRAGVKPDTISYVEAHGTATPLGDSIELAAMIKAFERGTKRKQFCAIGSIKPNIGHLDRASGVTGLIKTTLALTHKQIPPSLNFERPNPDVDLENSPFFVNTQLREWPSTGGLRRAGVNSFGLGGTNAHVVLEEAPTRPASPPGRPFELLLISAKTETALEAMTDNLAVHLRANPGLNLADVAYTLQVGRSGFNHRRALVCTTLAGAAAALEARSPELRSARQSFRDRPLILLLPDGGALRLAELADLYRDEASFRAAVDQCCAALQPLLGYHLRTPGAARHQAHADAESFTASYALGRLLQGWGLKPAGLLGSGSGEYAAAALAGVMTPEHALALLVRRAELLAEAITPAAFAAQLRDITLSTPSIPLVAQRTGTWLTAEQASDPSFWEHCRWTAGRFAEGLATIWQEPSRAALVLGPATLAAEVAALPASQALSDPTVVAALAAAGERPTLAQLLDAVAELWLGGVQPAWAEFSAGQPRLRLPLPTYAFDRRSYWLARKTPKPAAPAQADPSKRADLAEWFYLPVWKRALAQGPAAPPPPANWLILADAGGLGAALAERLGTRGERVTLAYAGPAFGQRPGGYTLDPANADDYRRLLSTLPAAPTQLLHLWSLDDGAAGPLDRARFDAAQQIGYTSLLHLVRALERHSAGTQRNLWAITRAGEQISGAETLRPEHATIAGACLVIAQENLDMRCRQIDIDHYQAGGWQGQRLVERLLGEFAAPTEDLAVAYRKNERWIKTYEPARLEPRRDGPALRAGGVYLITGGLGNIALLLAEHLSRTLKARLVLVSRSAFPPASEWEQWLAEHAPNDPTAERIRQLQQCQALGGDVLVLQANVADEPQLRAALEAAQARYGPLNGVFHTAGTSDERSFGAIQELAIEDSGLHFAAKVHGLLLLERLLADQQLDFCMLFSSLAAVLGGLGFVGYSAANSFIDAYAKQHNQHSPVPWLSVNWDTWSIKENPHGELGATVMNFAMQREEALAALERLVGYADQASQIINSTGNLEARLDQWVRMQEFRANPTGVMLHPRPNLLTPFAPPSSQTEQIIADIWQAVLRIEVGIHDNFLDLGGNSLIGTQIITRLRRAFQTSVPLTILFESPTVAEMAAAIELILIEELEQLDDEEVDRLVQTGN